MCAPFQIYLEGGACMKTFVSALAPSFKEFLDLKHSLGFKYQTAEFYLHDLDIYNYAHGNHRELTKDLVCGWALKQSERSISQDRSWIPPIREFGRFLAAAGHEDTYILDNKFTVKQYHANVYLMSEEEIVRFFAECDRYVLRQKSPGRPYVFPALYRFMYCCGVRAAEARNLKCTDVHLKEGYVDVLWTKTNSDRRLYLSDEFDAAISRIFPEREYFFPGTHGGICSSCSLSANFRNIWTAAGLKRDGKVKPRAYDFRHHFACANIMRWADEGKDIHAMLPYLMRYMGHASLESTYYYIHLFPDFFPKYQDLADSTEELLPEVDADEV